MFSNWAGIPSWITGASYSTFGSLSDPIGPYIAGNTAAIAFWSPGTWGAASAIGQSQGQMWTSQLAGLNSFGSSSYSYLGGLSSLIQWAGSGFLW